MRRLAIVLLLSFMSSVLYIGPSLAISGDINCTTGGSFTVTSNVVTGNTGCAGIANVPVGVTSIGNAAFFDNTTLTSITIPNSVTSIGNYAFYGNTALSSVTIPDSMISIGDWAFEGTGLTSLTLGNSLEIIGEGAFTGNASLTSITIPNSVISIGANAFSSNTALTSVTIGSGVTSIGNYAFSGNTALTSITIPNSVTSTGNYVFSGNTSLTSITIPNSVLSIGEGTFVGNTALTSITIPNSVTSIGRNAFENTALTSITIPNSVTSIGIYAFINNASLTSVTIGDNVTTIGDYAFENNAALTSVTIGNSVETIGEGAFYGNTALTEVIIPDSVTSVGASAFQGNTALTEVTIGSGVTSIGNYAFYGNTELNSVTFLGNAPSSVGSFAFSGVRTGATAYVTDVASGFTPAGDPPRWNGLAVSVVTTPSTNATITAGALAGVNVTGTFTGGATAETSSELTVTIPHADRDVASLLLTRGQANSTIKYVVNSGTTPANHEAYVAIYTGTDAVNVTSDQTIWILVTAQDGSTVLYYKIVVTVSSSDGGSPAPVPVIPTYQVIYLGNANGAVSIPYDFNSYTTGQEITVTNQLPAKQGYSYVEWNTSSSGGGTSYKAGAKITVGSSNVTLYAIWKINQYTISFDSSGGPILELGQITQDFDSSIIVPAIPKDELRIGYTFVGWNTKADGTGSPYAPSDKLRIGASDLTLFAQWKINQYSVSYEPNGNVIGRVPAAVTQDFNSLVTVSAPSQIFTRRGYAFTGWSATKDGSGTLFKIGDVLLLSASNQILYAVWSPNSYQVKFLNTSRDPLPSGQFLAGGEIASAPTPAARKGFSFRGWSSKADKSNIVKFPYVPGVVRDVTLYAVWAKTK